MLYTYNNLAAQISASKSQNNDFGRAVSLCLLIRNCRFLVVMSNYFFFFNSMVTVRIKPTAHHATVLTASVKKIQPPVLSHTISVRLSKKPGQRWNPRQKWMFYPSIEMANYI